MAEQKLERPEVRVGDTIRLDFVNYKVMSTDKFVPQEGDEGIVSAIRHIKNFANYGLGYYQIWVIWNNGKEFGLVNGMDAFTKTGHKWFCAKCNKPTECKVSEARNAKSVWCDVCGHRMV